MSDDGAMGGGAVALKWLNPLKARFTQKHTGHISMPRKFP
jgi:hypothetical protein